MRTVFVFFVPFFNKRTLFRTVLYFRGYNKYRTGFDNFIIGDVIFPYTFMPVSFMLFKFVFFFLNLRCFLQNRCLSLFHITNLRFELFESRAKISKPQKLGGKASRETANASICRRQIAQAFVTDRDPHIAPCTFPAGIQNPSLHNGIQCLPNFGIVRTFRHTKQRQLGHRMSVTLFDVAEQAQSKLLVTVRKPTFQPLILLGLKC